MPHAEGGLKSVHTCSAGISLLTKHKLLYAQSQDHTKINLVKSFILEREVINSNAPLLEGRVRSVLASLKYRGNVTFSFPVSHTAVVVTPGSQGAGLVTRLFSKIYDKKSYSFVLAVWPYANMASSSLVAAMEGQGGPRRVCAVQSEEGWWDTWSSVVASAIAEKRQGWVTTDDLLEEAMFGSKPAGKVSKVGRELVVETFQLCEDSHVYS